MTTEADGLGSLVATHAPAGGLAGLDNRKRTRIPLLTVAGMFVGLIPGLFVALFTDFVPALAIGALLGAVGGYLWARSLNFDAAVSGAMVYTDGMVLTDARGTHPVRWDEVATLEGKQVQMVAGTGYWLDNRIDHVGELAQAIVRGSNVRIVPMA